MTAPGEDVRVVGIDADGSAINEDVATGERWNADEHFLTLEAR